jgi:hypothetical protein
MTLVLINEAVRRSRAGLTHSIPVSIYTYSCVSQSRSVYSPMVLGPDTHMKEARSRPGGSSRKTFITTPVVLKVVISEKVGDVDGSEEGQDGGGGETEGIACPLAVGRNGGSSSGKERRIRINSITLSSFNLSMHQKPT